MAKSELGTKRIDPETGRKFYDLNKDPIVSPYTGKSYPRSFFESGSEKVLEDEVEEEQEVEGEEDAPETISLEDADEETKGGDDLPDIDDATAIAAGDQLTRSAAGIASTGRRGASAGATLPAFMSRPVMTDQCVMIVRISVSSGDVGV